MYAADTIAAIATPPGAGGIGIIRVSGRDAAAVCQRVIAGVQEIADWQSHHLHRVRLLAADATVIDEGMAAIMRAPHSYTGEDVIELHCHGSPLVLRQLLSHLLHHG